MMEANAIAEAVALLVDARRTGRKPESLPESCRPRTVDEAHAIQDAVAVALEEGVAGWKVATTPEGHVVHGGLLRSRLAKTGATLPSSRTPLLGVEAEIAFRFDRALPPRATEYSYDEVASAVTAFPAIEIVDSRYSTYPKTPLLDRVADFHSNGAFVQGEPLDNWRDLDLVNLEVELVIDGQSVVRKIGGHASKDPLLPAVSLANDLRLGGGIVAGQLVTTGTYTGLTFAKPGQGVQAIFHGVGSVSVQFDRGKEP